MVTILTIDQQNQIQTSLDALTVIEPKFIEVRTFIGIPQLRRRTDGFLALFRIIVGQQLSTASANAIWERLQGDGINSPSQLLERDDESLRMLGLSKTKISYCKGLAIAGINYKNLAKCSDQEVMNTLTKIRGIGEWTAQIYSMFSLGRADVFACGDLALQEAIRDLFHLSQRPTTFETELISKKWSPHRTVAAFSLWDFYNKVKSKISAR